MLRLWFRMGLLHYFLRVLHLDVSALERLAIKTHVLGLALWNGGTFSDWLP